MHAGIALSFVAMLCWGFGDLFIQRSARKIGDLEALFFITFFGVVVLFPFVAKELPSFVERGGETFAVFGALCIILLFAALLDFEALRVGKLAIVEPVWSFEVPVSAVLAFFILGEVVSGIQIALIAALLIGLAFTSIRKSVELRRFLIERGSILALFGAVMMGAANFFMGWSSRLSDPIMANFISDLFIAFVVGAILLATGRFSRTLKDVWRTRQILLPMSIADKAAWLAYAFSMSLAPIAVATALSESYIVVAVSLGIFVNKEKLLLHQKIGLVMAIVAALLLASVTT